MKRTIGAARMNRISAGATLAKKAATQFEAMLLQKWWSSMKQSGLGEDDDTDPGEDTLDNMGMQAMSTAVANSGGVGIAAMLVRSLQGELAAENARQCVRCGGNHQRERRRQTQMSQG